MEGRINLSWGDKVVTKARSDKQRTCEPAGRMLWGGRSRLAALCGTSLIILLSGCTSELVAMRWNSQDTYNSVFTKWVTLTNDEAQLRLEQAKELYRKQEYAQAGDKFHDLINPKKVPPAVAEEALFYEAECFRMRHLYPVAAQIYGQLLDSNPRGRFQKETLQHMYDIANYWIDETREVQQAQAEYDKGKRSVVWPVALVHFEDSKPFLDMQGHAMSLLEKIYLNDVDGPLGEEALITLGRINFFYQNYEEADHFFSELLHWHGNGKYAALAMELSIMCKEMSTHGIAYDGKPAADARDLVKRAQDSFPELNQNKSEFLQRQLSAINLQQAEKDLSIAEFYQRTGHPGSAYFYYELVRRRYPQTEQAKIATERMMGIMDRVEREKNGGDFWTWLSSPFAAKATAEKLPAKAANPLPVPPQASISPPQGYPQPNYAPAPQGYVPPGYSPAPQGYSPPGNGPTPSQPPEPLPAPRPVGGAPGYAPSAPGNPYYGAPGYGNPAAPAAGAQPAAQGWPS